MRRLRWCRPPATSWSSTAVWANTGFPRDGAWLPPEFSVLLVRDAARVNNAIVQTPAFNEWAVAHADVLL